MIKCPITLTDGAVDEIKSIFDSQGFDYDNYKIRLSVVGGGCLPPNQAIITDRGNIPISQVILSDKVLSKNGTFEEIINIYKRHYDGILYNIVPDKSSKLDNFYVTEEHPILTIDKDHFIGRDKNNRKYLSSKKEVDVSNSNFKTPSMLKKGDVLLSPVLIDEIDTDELNNDFCKFLGYYLAEGCVTYKYGKSGNSKGMRVELYFSKEEVELHSDVENILNNLSIKYMTKIRNNVRLFMVNNTEFSKRVEYYCGNNNKRNNTIKKIGKELLVLPHNKQKLFLDTYIAGDGNIRKNCMRISTVLKNLAMDIQIIINRVYNYSTCSLTNNNGKCIIEERLCNAKDTYEVVIWNNPINRKILSNNKINGITIRDIIKSSYKGDVYNITVEPSNTFVVGKFITHNCGGLQYNLGIDENIESTDSVYSYKDIGILIDNITVKYIDGVIVDYFKNNIMAGFQISNPQAKTGCGCGKSFSVEDSKDLGINPNVSSCSSCPSQA